MYDSIKILGLGFGATGSEVEDEVPKQLSHYYHPDRWDPIRTNMTLDQSTAHFQRHNNAPLLHTADSRIVLNVIYFC